MSKFRVHFMPGTGEQQPVHQMMTTYTAPPAHKQVTVEGTSLHTQATNGAGLIAEIFTDRASGPAFVFSQVLYVETVKERGSGGAGKVSWNADQWAEAK
jgi:hypothetical protein